MHPLIQPKTIPPLLITLALLCFVLLPKAQAVSPPPPDGGYPGFNTAEGQNALFSLDTSTGVGNTAVGWFSLFSDVEGSFNTATGAGALLFNTVDENTAVGAAALLLSTTGARNTAVGAAALLNNDNGASNSALGSEALTSNTTGDRNTAMGWQALVSNTTGAFNTAIGVEALSFNISGNFNIALGAGAGSNVTTANNVICIGSGGSDVSDTTWINNVYGVTTVFGTTLPVVVSDGGQLGTMSSSRRFKEEIKPMDKASESILGLKPVTFHYKSDQSNTPQFGLIAEEVAAVNPDLVVRDKKGEIYTVRHDAVNAMLLNEFLKEHRTVQELRNEVAALTATVKEQAAQIQKVSGQVAVTKFATGRIRRGGPARQVVTNDR
jgi:Chaperone of endosialidase